MNRHSFVSRENIVKTIHIVQNGLFWKPGSAEQHLKQRIRRGHLPPTATLAQYEEIIQNVLRSRKSAIYLFWHNDLPYISVVDEINGQYWLVMFAFNGILESAYIVERPEHYLNKVAFESIGLLSMVMSHDE